MKKGQTRILVLVMIVSFISAGLLMPGFIGAGDIEPPGVPGSTMHTLDEIYDKIDTVTCDKAFVAKTGQTTSYRTGDDGDDEAGFSLPNPRFTDNSDGTVTDNLTGLIWLKQANYNSTAGGTGSTVWNDAVDFCKALASGMCGLSDGSFAGDWRLPNVKELQSLIHYAYYNPSLPNTAGTGQWISGDPFTNVQSSSYWSATTSAGNDFYAWRVYMSNGYVNYAGKTSSLYVWPVRAGQ